MRRLVKRTIIGSAVGAGRHASQHVVLAASVTVDSEIILTSRLFSERHIETYKSAGRPLMIRILTAVCAILLSVGQPAAAEPVIKIGILTDMTGIPGSRPVGRGRLRRFAPQIFSLDPLGRPPESRGSRIANCPTMVRRRWRQRHFRSAELGRCSCGQ